MLAYSFSNKHVLYVLRTEKIYFTLLLCHFYRGLCLLDRLEQVIEYRNFVPVYPCIRIPVYPYTRISVPVYLYIRTRIPGTCVFYHAVPFRTCPCLFLMKLIVFMVCEHENICICMTKLSGSLWIAYVHSLVIGHVLRHLSMPNYSFIH